MPLSWRLRRKEQIFDDWSGWFFRSPFRRRTIIRSWRVLLRMQRATLASAVLVVRGPDGSLLTLPSSSGAFGLPRKALDGWRPIGVQVEEWLDQILRQASNPKLQAIDGTPGRKGVTFLYSADIDASPPLADGMWLDADLAPSTLSAGDRRLLLMSQ
jgi:hypothetical protein